MPSIHRHLRAACPSAVLLTNRACETVRAHGFVVCWCSNVPLSGVEQSEAHAHAEVRRHRAPNWALQGTLNTSVRFGHVGAAPLNFVVGPHEIGGSDVASNRIRSGPTCVHGVGKACWQSSRRRKRHRPRHRGRRWAMGLLHSKEGLPPEKHATRRIQ